MVINVEYLAAGLIAVAISLLAVLARYGNKGFRGDWLIAGVAIGILSPIIGLLMGGPILHFLYPDGPFAQLVLGLLIFIFSCICYTYIKKESSGFLLKIMVFSFAVVIFLAFAMSLTSDTGLNIIVEKIPVGSQINGFDDYINITEKELDAYPVLKKAIIECRDLNNCNSRPNIEEWMIARTFLEKKSHESGYLFSIMDESSEADLNQGILSPALRNGFESRGLLLSENAFISQASYQEINRWNIIDKMHLFDIKDTELENELDKVEITYGGVRKETRIPKLEQIFTDRGLLSPEENTIYRVPENWIIFNDIVEYGIKKENGILKVYTKEKWTYEIWKENGKLNIYKARSYPLDILKIAENYYRIYQQWED